MKLRPKTSEKSRGSPIQQVATSDAGGSRDLRTVYIAAARQFRQTAHLHPWSE
jgi:hypothetical protein